MMEKNVDRSYRLYVTIRRKTYIICIAVANICAIIFVAAFQAGLGIEIALRYIGMSPVLNPPVLVLTWYCSSCWHQSLL